MKQNLIALISGLLFGVGLTVSQMVDPNKILNFLAITEAQWDASLIFVMFGALAVFGMGYRMWCAKKTRPIWAPHFSLPEKVQIDRPLIIGAVIFGVGWGLGGLCPGPALANVLMGNEKVFAFIAMMILGMWVGRLFRR